MAVIAWSLLAELFLRCTSTLMSQCSSTGLIASLVELSLTLRGKVELSSSELVDKQQSGADVVLFDSLVPMTCSSISSTSLTYLENQEI